MKTEKYIGKTILVALNFFDESDEIIEQYQTHGTITSIDENGMMKIERNGEPVFALPLNEDSMQVAKSGTYRERCSGTEIENPKFITHWDVTSLAKENREFQKQHGFVGFDNNDKQYG